MSIISPRRRCDKFFLVLLLQSEAALKSAVSFRYFGVSINAVIVRHRYIRNNSPSGREIAELQASQAILLRNAISRKISARVNGGKFSSTRKRNSARSCNLFSWVRLIATIGAFRIPPAGLRAVRSLMFSKIFENVLNNF